MRKLCRVLPALALLAVASGTALAGTPARLMQYPDIRGDVIVFSYEGDLWKTTASGGCAQRLTSHPGNEFAAKISPDGGTIAFFFIY